MADRSSFSLEAMGVNLPFNSEAEQAVLGAIIVDSSVIDEVGGLLQSEYFYQRQNAQIYNEMVLMFNGGKPVDFVTVLDAVDKAGIFETREDAKEYIFNISQTVPTISNVGSYAKIVYEKYLTRALITTCRDIIDSSKEGHDSASTLLDFAEQRIYEIRDGRANTDLWELHDVLFQVMDHLNKINGPDRNLYKGIDTGFSYLDRMITGLNKSDLIILAARPGVGKTSFALNIATNVAKAYEKSAVAFFSLEMTKQQLAQRILSSESHVESSTFRLGGIQPKQWTDIASAASALSKVGIFIDDTSMISVQEMKAKARRVKNLSLVIVDYLQLMGGVRTDSRVNEISDITRQFKIMAKELNVPVVLLSQLSRDSEKAGRPPRLSDLRDSGSIEQDADIVMFLNRETAVGEETEQTSEVQLLVAKNRHGETGKLALLWDPQYTRFYSVERGREY